MAQTMRPLMMAREGCFTIRPQTSQRAMTLPPALRADWDAAGTAIQVILYLGSLVGAQLAIDELLESRLNLVAIHSCSPPDQAAVERAASVRRFRSMRRPRKRRDITVPSGTSSMSAISLY